MAFSRLAFAEELGGIVDSKVVFSACQHFCVTAFNLIDWSVELQPLTLVRNLLVRSLNLALFNFSWGPF